MVEDSEPALLVVGDRLGAPAQVPTLTLGADGAGTLADATSAFPSGGTDAGVDAIDALGDLVTAADRGPDDLAAMLYTSGTTGRPKGAMLTHRGLVADARALVDAWGFTGDDVLVHALPIFHVHGLFVALHCRCRRRHGCGSCHASTSTPCSMPCPHRPC